MLPFMKVVYGWLRLPETRNGVQTGFVTYSNRGNVCQDRLTCMQHQCHLASLCIAFSSCQIVLATSNIAGDSIILLL